ALVSGLSPAAPAIATNIAAPSRDAPHAFRMRPIQSLLMYSEDPNVSIIVAGLETACIRIPKSGNTHARMRRMRRLSAVLIAMGCLFLRAVAQEPVHLNPVIAKLAAGKTVYGLITGDMSLANARETARAPVDFVYADMEHSPLDFPGLAIFL